VLIIAIVHVVAGALFGAALARWARFSVWLGIALGILVPVLGPIVAAIMVAARRPPKETSTVRPKRMRINAVLLIIPATVMSVALFLPWWNVRLEGMPRIPLFPTGRLLDTLVIVTLVVVVGVGIVVAAFGTVNLGAALLLMPLVAWTFVLYALGAATRSIHDALAGLASFSYTTGDLLGFIGLSLDNLPLDELEVDADNVDLMDFVGTASLELGPGWFAMIAASALLAMWVIWASLVSGRTAKE